jgi:hypothetical protein
LTTSWYAGLDLGKVRDSTALAILEPYGSRLLVTYLRAWRPERDDCVDALGEVLRLVDRDKPDAVALALDARGLGRTAAEVALEGELSHRLDVYPILPSHSDRPHRQRPDGYVWVGKKGLVGSLITAIEADRVRLKRGLSEADAFLRELERLRPLPTKGGTSWTWSHPTQQAHDHDDRVVSVALALFVYDHSTRTGVTDPLRIRPANRRKP